MVSIGSKISRKGYGIVELRDADTEKLKAVLFSGKLMFGDIVYSAPFVSFAEWEDLKTGAPCITILV